MSETQQVNQLGQVVGAQYDAYRTIQTSIAYNCKLSTAIIELYQVDFTQDFTTEYQVMIQEETNLCIMV